MIDANGTRIFYLGVIAVSLMATSMVTLHAQSDGYRRMDSWAQLPPGGKFGSVASAAVAPDGSVYAFQRADPPILHFDASGKLLKTWGAGMFASEHGITVDKLGNVWVVDYQIKDGKGSQVFKFSADGKLLMTLGKAGVAGSAPGEFDQPTSVVFAPNGDIFVSEGHNNPVKKMVEGNHRIQKFAKDGKFIKMWGKMGSGPGEFSDLHAIAFDSEGRLFAADRGNNRLQIFDQDGKFIDQWTQFGKPSDVYIVNDILYIADAGPSAGAGGPAPNWKKGIRIGSAKDGKVTGFIEDVDPKNPGWSTDPNGNGPEGCAADASGNVYASYIGQQRLVKFAKQ